jgi:hypothetical protein
MEKVLFKFLGDLQWPIYMQPGIAGIPDNSHEPCARIAASEAGKESEGAQVCFLDHVLGIVFIARQPACQVVGCV